MAALVRADGADVPAGIPFGVRVHWLQGDDRFGGGERIVPREVGAQPMPVFHQRVRAKTPPGLLPARLPIQHAVRIRRAVVRVVASWLAAKVNRGIAGIFVLGRLDVRVIRAVLADETFQARPRFDQRPGGGEVCGARPACGARPVIDFAEKQFRHGGGADACVVLGKNAVVETARGKLAVQKPAPEEIVTKLFAAEPLAADAVERGQHAGLEQWLRRDAGAAVGGLEFGKERREVFQDGIHLAFEGAQRMVGRHALVEVDHRQKIRLGLDGSTHGASDTTQREKFQRKIVF